MPVAVSIFPVIIFLIMLFYSDSYKLVKPGLIFIVIGWGFASAPAVYPINTFFLEYFSKPVVSQFIAPVIEESFKFAIILFLLKTNRIGFLSDALILGFASGAGFSIMENIYYLRNVETDNLMLWLIRGLGTAVMHGTAVSVTAVIVQYYISKYEKIKLLNVFSGLFTGVFIHSLFNSSFIPAFTMTLLQIIILPMIILSVFGISEKHLKGWMESQFDSEFELLQMIRKGEFKSTRAGKYIISIKNRFEPEVLVDMMAYIQLYLELSIKAKGMLLMQETGFEPEKSSELKENLDELNFLSKSIGRAGMLTLMPILRMKKKDLWKINFLK